jgi:hypothetical protein
MRFRNAFEEYASTSRDSSIQRFPHGCCKTASILLARYLDELGFGRAELVANAFRQPSGGETHAWLRLGGWDIDITADQFNSDSHPVIFEPAGTARAGFSGQTIHAWDEYMRFSAASEARFDGLYSGIVAVCSLS